MAENPSIAFYGFNLFQITFHCRMRYFVSEKRHIQKSHLGWYFYNNDDRDGKDNSKTP